MKQTKQAVVYSCIIQLGQDVFSGFGITENEQDRKAAHIENLTIKGFRLLDWVAYPAPSIKEARAIEDVIKKNVMLTDLKVDGFREEACQISQHGYVNQLIVSLLNPKANNPKGAILKSEVIKPHYSEKLATGDKTTFNKNVARWESIIETAWGGKISGDRNRAFAKESMEKSLELVRNGPGVITIALPHQPGWDDWNAVHYGHGENDFWKQFELKKGPKFKFVPYNSEQKLIKYKLDALRFDVRFTQLINEKNPKLREKALQEREAKAALRLRKRRAKPTVWDFPVPASAGESK